MLEYGFQFIVGDGDVQTIRGDNGSWFIYMNNQNGGYSLSIKNGDNG